MSSGKILISDRQTGLYVFRFAEPPFINSDESHGIYPNPFSDEAWFYFDNDIEAQYELFIFDVSGRIVQHYATFDENYLRLHAGHLARGTYYYLLNGTNIDRQERGSFILGGEGN